MPKLLDAGFEPAHAHLCTLGCTPWTTRLIELCILSSATRVAVGICATIAQPHSNDSRRLFRSYCQRPNGVMVMRPTPSRYPPDRDRVRPQFAQRRDRCRRPYFAFLTPETWNFMCYEHEFIEKSSIFVLLRMPLPAPTRTVVLLFHSKLYIVLKLYIPPHTPSPCSPPKAHGQSRTRMGPR